MMIDEKKTKKELIGELVQLREQITELEKSALNGKQGEKALEHVNGLISCITETSPVGITVVNRNGHIIFANARAEQVLGVAKDESTQGTCNARDWYVTEYDGNPFPDKELPFFRVMASGRPVFDLRHAIEWPDGRKVLLSINAAPLFGGAGEVS